MKKSKLVIGFIVSFIAVFFLGTVQSKTADASTNVTYRTHVQKDGWKQGWQSNGLSAGTTGRALRLEGIEVKLENAEYIGNIEYRTHIQKIGWETNYIKNGALSGTSGKALRLEAIQIKLTGEIANHYDVYYRVHAQSFGWLGWASNGASAGTAGYSYRLEAIQIKLVEKGGAAPGSTATPFKQAPIPVTPKVQEEQNMVWAMNKIRVSKGLPKLENSADMNKWSQSRRAWVAENVSHGSWTVGKPEYLSYSAENLFWGHSGIGGVLSWANEVMTASQLVAIFGKSTIDKARVSLSETPTKAIDGVTGHYDNIVNPNFNLVGVAYESKSFGTSYSGSAINTYRTIGIANFGKK